MHQFLARRWFLLLLGAGVLLALLAPDWLRPLVQPLPPQGLVAVALFLMAWTLESRRLGEALLRPLPALWAAVISYGALPLLALFLTRVVPLPDDFRVGLLLMASVPCTLASAVLWTRMAGGNEATALLAILLTTCTSWLITPLWLAPLAASHIGLNTIAMMRDLLLFLVLPVGLGQLARLPRPLREAAGGWKPSLGIVSQLLILAIILKAAVSVCDRVHDSAAVLAPGPFVLIALVCAGTHLAALFAGLGSSRLLRFDRPSRLAIAFACSQKTLPVALLLFETYFKGAYPLAVVPLVFYHIGQLVLDTFIADHLRQQGCHSPQSPTG